MYPRILICGSRDWNDWFFMRDAFIRWCEAKGLPQLIIEGCARGADTIAGHMLAPEYAIDVAHFPADWDRHGRAAGPIRNQQMLDEGRPDAVIAFTRDLRISRGTRDMVTRARRAGLPVWLPVAGSDDPSAR